MPLKETTLQRQLEVAQQERSTIEEAFAGKELKKQPKWRQANAAVVSLEGRLAKAQSRSASTVETAAEAETGADEEE